MDSPSLDGLDHRGGDFRRAGRRVSTGATTDRLEQLRKAQKAPSSGENMMKGNWWCTPPDLNREPTD